MKGFRRALDGLRVTIDRIVAGDDEVMAWWSFVGTHVAPWLGRTPTGAEISGTVFSFFDLVDGKVSRYRVWLHALLDEPVVFDSSRPVVPSSQYRAAAGSPDRAPSIHDVHDPAAPSGD